MSEVSGSAQKDHDGHIKATGYGKFMRVVIRACQQKVKIKPRKLAQSGKILKRGKLHQAGRLDLGQFCANPYASVGRKFA
ncbi:MAG: hypothetical protein ACMZ66_01875 [Thalassospira sp.]|uniref:hypothetical protein n=1 Tax=Thalassospira sp. TaxID=1912094 RepID=UPI003A8B6771